MKTVRVFANMSVDAGQGERLATDDALVAALIDLYAKNPPNEVKLAAVSAMCNLSFYPVVRHGQVFDCVMEAFESNAGEVATEAARALGNLTRRQDVRKRLSGDVTPLLSRLDSAADDDGEDEMSYALVGVFVNLMTDLNAKKQFAHLGGLTTCLKLLSMGLMVIDKNNWPLLTLTCQLLWNFFTDFDGVFDQENPDFLFTLEETLISLIDKEEEGESYTTFSVTALHLLGKLDLKTGRK